MICSEGREGSYGNRLVSQRFTVLYFNFFKLRILSVRQRDKDRERDRYGLRGERKKDEDLGGGRGAGVRGVGRENGKEGRERQYVIYFLFYLQVYYKLSLLDFF